MIDKSGFPRVHTPDEYAERLVNLAEALMHARQRVEFEVLARTRAEQALGEHLAVPIGEQRLAQVGGLLFTLQRCSDRYLCQVHQIHAFANEVPPA